ncbi:MAG: DUF3606 domain-containing protein [Rubrivivax sp.]|nr:MAG: DUF3606 domain-containing protein [Rubrivivax sp.]
MSDHTPTHGAQHAQRIGLHEDQEVHGWCETLGVTEEQLRVAIAAVGDEADEVRSHFGQQS